MAHRNRGLPNLKMVIPCDTPMAMLNHQMVLYMGTIWDNNGDIVGTAWDL
jgi:hypothetical protein